MEIVLLFLKKNILFRIHRMMCVHARVYIHCGYAYMCVCIYIPYPQYVIFQLILIHMFGCVLNSLTARFSVSVVCFYIVFFTGSVSFLF